jgi:hypothetical protein
MANMQLDPTDRAMLNKLDTDFVVSADGESATLTGEMTVTVLRSTDGNGNRLRLRIQFPGGEPLDVWMLRDRLLQELAVTGPSS